MYISWNSWNFLERKQVHVGSQELPSPKKCINNPENVPAYMYNGYARIQKKYDMGNVTLEIKWLRHCLLYRQLGAEIVRIIKDVQSENSSFDSKVS